VITLIKLPPYGGPRSPLDLVSSEIMFGRLFEVFRLMSQARTEDLTLPMGEDSRQPKKACRVLVMRKILVAKYVFSCP
jgi:hypothetical protein